MEQTWRKPRWDKVAGWEIHLGRFLYGMDCWLADALETDKRHNRMRQHTAAVKAVIKLRMGHRLPVAGSKTALKEIEHYLDAAYPFGGGSGSRLAELQLIMSALKIYYPYKDREEDPREFRFGP